MKRVLWIIAAMAVCMGAVPAFAGAVTFESLVGELTNLERLSETPSPAYVTKQFSSYDRRSKNPSVLTDEDWFANGDRGQYLRKETIDGREEFVIMDAEGPGAIVRVWSANPADAGTVRVYLDGSKKPAIEMRLTEMLGGSGPMPFLKPISHEVSRGWNTYLPIPYAKHCLVTTSKSDYYYHINYRTYAKGTKVKTYPGKLSKKQQQLVQNAADFLAKPSQFVEPASPKAYQFAYDMGPGATVKGLAEGSSRAVYAFRAKVDAADMEAALRGCLLEIRFDDETTPSVQAPLGDFFGTAPGLNKFESLPCGVMADGSLYSYWVMPYKKSAEFRITNHTNASVKIKGETLTGTYKWSDKSMYFHAKWRTEHPIHTLPRQDWNYLDASGAGRFVGGMLHITNPVKQWWGEGDEKIYVDNEPFPSHFGTGTEDYYGYAWCFNVPFVHAYHNQPRCDGPDNYGQTCVSRYHIIDDIPFTKHFKFDIEVWHWAECDIAMAETSFWYAKPGATDTFAPIDPISLKVIAPPPLPVPKKVEGAIEGETLREVERTGGSLSKQDAASYGWSGDAQGWWTDGKPGDTLTIGFPVEKAGRYKLLAVFTKAVDYGIAKLSVNGQSAGDPIDFYNDGVVSTPETSLGVFDLKAGENLLKVEITGANAKAVPRHMLGLDYLRLEPAG
ncbi:MAG: DUF2961 domain-containing protein [Candidatus Hydrogenedentes bacterium]|nr:DUF2961 domain-containing protein [Candidatus Hydrogenedentota bacterium]